MVVGRVSATDTESITAPSWVTMDIGDGESMTDGFLTPGKVSGPNPECLPGIFFFTH